MRPTRLLAALGAGLVLFSGRRSLLNLADKVVGFGQEAAFAAVLPSALAQYAPLVLEVSRERGISPWLLAGIIWLESNAGLQLTPQGPGGTGDFIKRDPARWKMAAPNGLPPDGKGWGRGLCQIDYGVHLAWVNANAWWDPRVNITKSADILQELVLDFSAQTVLNPKYTYGGKVAIGGTPAAVKLGLKDGQLFNDPRPLSGAALYEAALSAYNAGALQVLQAIAAGRPAESVTYGGGYTTYVGARLAAWTSKYKG